MAAASSPAKQSGQPDLLRNTVMQLDSLEVDDPKTGWRDTSEARVKELKTTFLGGAFGLSVCCGVTVLEKESANGKKLIDDGVSTIKALLECRAFFADNPSEVPPKSLTDIFKLGLGVRVIVYPDDDDREARECWNIARHDEESNQIRWSSLAQKIGTVLAQFKRMGEWKAVSTKLETLYGEVKKSTIGRWVRAAKGVHPEVLESLKAFPDMRGSYLWDNGYLVLSQAKARERLGPEFAVIALGILQEWKDDLNDQKFRDTVCKPLKYLEVWITLMGKRYGAVATNSPAFKRLQVRLATRTGLQSVRMCMESHVILHGTGPDNQGIPECYLLCKEFDKCRAGGLPPPTRIPSEADLKESEASALKKEAEDKAALAEAEEATKKQLAEKEREDENSMLMEEADLALLTTSSAVGSAGGVAATLGSAGGVAATPNKTAAMESMEKVKMSRVISVLANAVKAEAQKSPERICLLVEAPTTGIVGFGPLLDDAFSFWTAYGEGCRENGAEPSKCRCIILVGSRWDLIAKCMEKGSKLWPAWSFMVVQVQHRDRQSMRARPAYAVVGAPSGELSHTELTVMTPPRTTAKAASKYGLHMRCTEAACKWRPQAYRAEAGDRATENAKCDIEPDDCEHLLEDMFNEIDTEPGEGVDAAGDEEVIDMGDKGGEEAKRDAIVDLWPYANTPEFYMEVLTLLGAGAKAKMAAIISTTANPGHWLACLRMGMDPVMVLSRKWSEHSENHGKALGRRLLELEGAGSPALSQAALGGQPAMPAICQYMDVALKRSAHESLEAYDLSQGSAWNEGLNRVVLASMLVRGSHALVRREAEEFSLRLSAIVPGKGRGLEALKATREGEVVCNATALFFDSWDALASLLGDPQCSGFADRVCRIRGVMRSEEETTVWAVLVGAAQFVQHFQGYRARANAMLEFDATRGFNNGALRIVAATRTGVGIAAGAPVLLNYGPDFDLEWKAPECGKAMLQCALDDLFPSRNGICQRRTRLTRRRRQKKRRRERKQRRRCRRRPRQRRRRRSRRRRQIRRQRRTQRRRPRRRQRRRHRKRPRRSGSLR